MPSPSAGADKTRPGPCIDPRGEQPTPPPRHYSRHRPRQVQTRKGNMQDLECPYMQSFAHAFLLMSMRTVMDESWITSECTADANPAQGGCVGMEWNEFLVPCDMHDSAPRCYDEGKKTGWINNTSNTSSALNQQDCQKLRVRKSYVWHAARTPVLNGARQYPLITCGRTKCVPRPRASGTHFWQAHAHTPKRGSAEDLACASG
jgi:hypothetical protein